MIIAPCDPSPCGAGATCDVLDGGSSHSCTYYTTEACSPDDGKHLKSVFIAREGRHEALLVLTAS